MTENRCIEVLKKMKHMFTETCAKIDENTALNMAVEAIEEIQQYRAIGTPTQILEKIGGLDVELGKYYSIGTIDEFKQAMNFKKYFMELYDEGLEVANWHKNGDLEPLVNFIDEACN